MNYRTILYLTGMFILMVLPANASLSCNAGEEAFFLPNLLERESITLPCTVEVDQTTNVSCVGMIFFQGDLLSTYPPIEDVQLKAKEAYLTLHDVEESDSFTMSFSNTDLLHEENVTWQVWCKNAQGISYGTEGHFITRIKPAEPITDHFLTFFSRDAGFTWIWILLILFIIIIGGVAVHWLRNI